MVARYTEGPRRFVPRLLPDLHTMTGILVAERAPAGARILVLGAGGELELRALADKEEWLDIRRSSIPRPRCSRWRGRRFGTHAPRVRLHQGLINIAPEGPFDAAPAC